MSKQNERKERLVEKIFFSGLFFSILVSVFCCAENLSAEGLKKKIEWVEAESGWNRVLISWMKNEYLSETETLVLVRKKENCPRNIFDGEELYRGNGAFFEDKTAILGEEYCYGVGISSLAGGLADFKTSQLAKSLSFQQRAVFLLTGKVNLVIFLEVIFLVGFSFYRRIKNKQLLADKTMARQE